MRRVSFVFIYICTQWILHSPRHADGANLSEYEGQLTTYCVDPVALDIFQDRVKECLGGRSISEEIKHLRASNAFHYHHSQELFAHEYFLSSPRNHRYRSSCRDADFEYIPLLPLSWKVEVPANTLCTAGGVCPKQSVSHTACGTSRIIEDIVRFVRYKQKTAGMNLNEGIPRFIVTGAFNFKTILGKRCQLHIMLQAVRLMTVISTRIWHVFSRSKRRGVRHGF